MTQTDKARKEAQNYVYELQDAGEEEAANSLKQIADKNIVAFKDQDMQDTIKMFLDDDSNEDLVEEACNNIQNVFMFDDRVNGQEVFEDYKDSNGDFKPNLLAKDIEEEYEFLYSTFEDNLYVYKDGYYQDDGERTVKEEVNKKLDNELKSHYMSEVLNAIKTRPGIAVDHREFVPPKFKINFENGVYDLETGDFNDHSPDMYFTQQVPWEYDPSAEPEDLNDFFGEITRNSEDRQTLYELSGYAMMTSMPISNAFMLAGQGSNGKTVFLNTLEKLIGHENTKHEDLQQIESSRFATQSIHQKLMVISDDLPSEELEEGNTLKALTGGGTVRAEYKGGDHFEFDNYALPVFAANEIPPTKDQSNGFFRRWTIIDFPYTFTEDPEGDMEKEKEPEFKLMRRINSDEEMKGYVAKSVQAVQKVFDQGKFTNTNTPEETRMKWNSYADPVMEFLQKYVEQGVTQNEAERRSTDQTGVSAYMSDDSDLDWLVKDDLYNIVSLYAESKNHRAPTKSAMTRRMNRDTEMYFSNTQIRQVPDEDGQTPVYRGVKWSDEFEQLCRDSDSVEEFWDSLDLKSVSGQLPQRVAELVTELGPVDDDESDDNPTHSSVHDTMKTLINSMDDAEEQEIVELVAMTEDVTEEKADEILKNLKHRGQLYNPSSGVVEVM